jgi:hypothetical protein
LSSQFAEFASSGERMVFNLESCRRAMSGHVVRWGNDRRAAVDLSGGGNKTVLGKRLGNSANFEWKSRERNHIHLADQLLLKFRWLQTHYGIIAEEIFADQGGLGAPIINYLTTKKGFHLQFFNFAARPKDPVRYLNARAEMAFELNEMIVSGDVQLPSDDDLMEQLKWIKWEQHDDTRLKIIAKREMPDSPDEYDVVAMLFYNMPRKDYVQNIERRRNKMLSPVPVGGDYQVFDWKGSEDEGFAFY